MPPRASGSNSHSNDSNSSSNGGSYPLVSSISLRALFDPKPSTVLADLAPQLLQSRFLGSPHFTSRSPVATSLGSTSGQIRARLGWPGKEGRDSNSIYILEKVDELCRMEVPDAPFDLNGGAAGGVQGDYLSPDTQVPLIRGFLATTPAAKSARLDRRRKRAGLSDQALLLEAAEEGKDQGLIEGVGELGINRRTGASRKKKRRGKDSFSGSRNGDEVLLSPEELVEQTTAVEEDMSNVAVRRALLTGQMSEVDAKIAALDLIREGLRRNMLGLREEELELEDELYGLQEQIGIQEERKKGRTVTPSSRRRKGPAFLPSEHDDLPSGVAFMTLVGHLAPITSLDFSEPYGVAVTASLDESVRLWDLTTGDALGFLKGHSGAVKALQVEGSLCVTGGTDGQIRIWDLDVAESTFNTASSVPLSAPAASDQQSSSIESVLLGQATDVFGTPISNGGAGLVNEDEGMMREESGAAAAGGDGPCVRTLDGHTKAVTSLYFDGSCLVTGSSDRTLRQWDLTTGQCVLTMDILWAISNPSASQTLSSSPLSTPTSSNPPYSPLSSPSPSRTMLGALRRQSSSFLGNTGEGGPTTTTYSDGTWEMYEDYVGGVQFWGYALASGTGDGCVRMWDMRTGQAHRTLVGHTGPVTCVQFDEYHLVSGSLDKSVRIWDLRTGAISDTIRYDHPITSLQFDSRKIVAAAGENGVRVFNRTTLQQTSLTHNGHTGPVEKLRFMDRYLATGGRDCAVKLWSLS